MSFSKENIFVTIVALIVLVGGIHVRMTDLRYTGDTKGSAPLYSNKLVFGKDMSLRRLPSGSKIATGGTMLYFFINDARTLQFDFKSAIKNIMIDSISISVAVQDSIYTIPLSGNAASNRFMTEIQPIPIAALKLFSQGASFTD